MGLCQTSITQSTALSNKVGGVPGEAMCVTGRETETEIGGSFNVDKKMAN